LHEFLNNINPVFREKILSSRRYKDFGQEIIEVEQTFAKKSSAKKDQG